MVAVYSTIVDDPDLHPIPGVKVTIRAADESLAALFDPDNFAIPLDNPVTSDAFGRVAFAAADAVYSGEYRFAGVLRRVDSMIVGNPPQYIGPTGPADNTFVTLAAFKAAATTIRVARTSQIGGVPDGNWFWTLGDFTGLADDINVVKANSTALSVGAWVRQKSSSLTFSNSETTGPGTVADRLKRFVVATDPPFSAKGNGTTDDRAAIQAALDYIGGLGGGEVALPFAVGGRYRITSGLKLPTYTALVGVGPSRYPFNAGNANSSAIVADFANPNQWVIEPKTTVGGNPVDYNVMITGALPNGPTYNCAVRNLVVTSTGNLPYGGIRMHGCPGSVVDNVAINRVGCGLLVNCCFGGNYSVHCLTAYYGVVAWDDSNGNTFEAYVARDNAYTDVVPNGYLMSFMTTLNGQLTNATYGLASNAHYNRATGICIGSLGSTSNANVMDVVIERFATGTFTLYGYSTDFRKMYAESGANEMLTFMVGALSAVTLQTMHAYQSGTGVFWDIGKGAYIDVRANGSLFAGGWGVVALDNSTRMTVRGASPTTFGPTTLQFNILYEMPGAFIAPPLVNSWANIAGDLDSGYRRENGRVYLNGAVNGGASASVITTLPAGYRPYLNARGPGFTISAAGVVTATTTGPISLTGYSFEAIQ